MHKIQYNNICPEDYIGTSHNGSRNKFFHETTLKILS